MAFVAATMEDVYATMNHAEYRFVLQRGLLQSHHALHGMERTRTHKACLPDHLLDCLGVFLRCMRTTAECACAHVTSHLIAATVPAPRPFGLVACRAQAGLPVIAATIQSVYVTDSVHREPWFAGKLDRVSSPGAGRTQPPDTNAACLLHELRLVCAHAAPPLPVQMMPSCMAM